MKKLAWATKGLAAVTGAVLAGAVMAPSAAAADVTPDAMTIAQEVTGLAFGDGNGKRCRIAERDVSTAIVGDPAAGVPDTVVRVTTDRKGNAYLNDSRNNGIWIPLALVPGTPDCTEDLDIVADDGDGTTATDEVLITLLAGSGKIYEVRCDITPGVPLTGSNIGTQCAPGFTQAPGTPV